MSPVGEEETERWGKVQRRGTERRNRREAEGGRERELSAERVEGRTVNRGRGVGGETAKCDSEL